MKGSSITKYVLVLMALITVMVFNANASENVSWQSKTLSAGKIDLKTGAYEIKRSLGDANFSPEFAMPIEVIYNSKSDTTGIFGYRWNSPQLESRVFPQKNAAEWITPWGEKISFHKKSMVRKHSDIADAFEDSLKGKGYFSIYGDWEATGAKGNWTINGRMNKDYQGWKFIYKNSRLTEISSPQKRKIKFNYSGSKLTSVSQGGTQFINFDYKKENVLEKIALNGINIKIDIEETSVQRMPEAVDQEIATTLRPELVGIQVGSLEKEIFSYSNRGWLIQTTRGTFGDILEVATETLEQCKKRLIETKKLQMYKKEYDAAVAYSVSKNRTPEEYVEAKAKVDSLKETLRIMNAQVNKPHATKAEGTLLKDKNFVYTVVKEHGGISGIYIRNLEGNTADYSFNDGTGVLTIKNFAGLKQTIYYYRRYDVAYNGMIRQIIDSKNRVVAKYRYDNDTGNLMRVRGMTGNEMLYKYNSMNQLVEISRLKAGEEKFARPLYSFAYAKNGHPEKANLLDQKGETVLSTEFVYDNKSQVTSVKTIDGVESIEYTGKGQIRKVTDRFGRNTRRSYDKYNRLTSVIDMYGAETQISYDENGQLASIKRYKPKTVGKKSELASSVNFSYDKFGEVASMRDNQGREKSVERDNEGRIIKELFADNTAINYSYNKFGQLDNVHDRRGNPIKFAWSKFGGMASRTTAVGQQSIYKYDSYGLISGVKSISKDGDEDRYFSYTRDEFDRITYINFGGGKTKSFTYANDGKLIKTETESEEETLTLDISYDEFDRVVKRVESRFDNVSEEKEITTTEIAYNKTGKRTALVMTFPNGTKCEQKFKHDKLGRLIEIDQNEKKLQYQYDEFSRVAKQIVAGTPIRYNYDNQGRLVEKYIQDKNGEMLANLKYFYNDNDEITAREINGQRQNFEYDLRGQLLAVKSEDGVPLESYKYDAAGNLLEKTVFGETTFFTYDAANQLISQRQADGTSKEFAYDAAGRLVKEGNKSYNYAWLDKVVSVAEDGETVAEFSYSSNGQLGEVRRANGKNEKLYWNNLALLKRTKIEDDQETSESYLNEPYVTGGNPVLSWVGEPRQASSAPRVSGEQSADAAREDMNTKIAKEAATRLLFNDMLGSTVATLEGQLVAGDISRDGDSQATQNASSARSGVSLTGLTLFGESDKGDNSHSGYLGGTGSVSHSGSLFFTGKPQVEGLGYTFLFRNYRSGINKWQTADPLGYPDGLNNFAYVNNGVTTLIDKLGLNLIFIKEIKSITTQIKIGPERHVFSHEIGSPTNRKITNSNVSYSGGIIWRTDKYTEEQYAIYNVIQTFRDKKDSLNLYYNMIKNKQITKHRTTMSKPYTKTIRSYAKLHRIIPGSVTYAIGKYPLPE